MDGAGTLRSLLWQALFMVCVCLVLIPTPLLEFRYFIVPFLMLLLHEHRAQPDREKQHRRVGEDPRDRPQRADAQHEIAREDDVRRVAQAVERHENRTPVERSIADERERPQESQGESGDGPPRELLLAEQHR